METIEVAKKMIDVCRGLDEVICERPLQSEDQKEKDLVMNLMGGRDRINELATLLAQDESVSQEMNKRDDDEAEKNLEEDVNNS